MPGLASLSPLERTHVLVDELGAGAHKLGPKCAAAGIALAKMDTVREALGRTGGTVETLRELIAGVHVELQRSLVAADFRLGKAYRLGRELADTALWVESADDFDSAFGARTVALKDSLADLASSFPTHASRAVVLSLRAWEAWAADPQLDGEALEWSTQGSGVRSALRRQAELWRALLSSEKRGRDMLALGDYLHATNRLAAAAVSTAWRVLRPVWWLILVLIGLLGGGIALLAVSDTFGKILGAFIAVAGALGVTGAGARARLGRAAQPLQASLLGAELDLAIGRAITIGPEGWGIAVAEEEVAPTGGAPRAAAHVALIAEFREAVERGNAKRIKRLLATKALFRAEDSVRGRDEVADWLVSDPTAAARVAASPKVLLAGRPGFFVAYQDKGADIWRVREGHVKLWQQFGDHNSARRAAGLAAETPSPPRR